MICVHKYRYAQQTQHTRQRRFRFHLTPSAILQLLYCPPSLASLCVHHPCFSPLRVPHAKIIRRNNTHNAGRKQKKKPRCDARCCIPFLLCGSRLTAIHASHPPQLIYERNLNVNQTTSDSRCPHTHTLTPRTHHTQNLYATLAYRSYLLLVVCPSVCCVRVPCLFA